MICQINYNIVYLFLDFQVAKDSSVEKLIVRMKSWYLEKDGECQSSPYSFILYTVKPVLSDHSKIDKTKVLKTNGSLMKVESIAECSLGAFCNTFDLH